MVVKLADLLLGAEEARENLPLYLFFISAPATLVTTLVILKKVKHDHGHHQRAGRLFHPLCGDWFCGSVFAFHLMSRVGFMPIEILIYFSFIVLVLSALVSYRFFMEMTSGKKTRRPRR
jgi:phosphoketolase